MPLPRLVASLVAVAMACSALHSTARGQGAAPAPKTDRTVDVSVQYSLRLPLRTRDVDEQREVMEQGRRLLYQLTSGECALLLVTLASSCEVHRLNVQTNSHQQRAGEDFMTVGGNAQFKIGLKPAN